MKDGRLIFWRDVTSIDVIDKDTILRLKTGDKLQLHLGGVRDSDHANKVERARRSLDFFQAHQGTRRLEGFDDVRDFDDWMKRAKALNRTDGGEAGFRESQREETLLVDTVENPTAPYTQRAAAAIALTNADKQVVVRVRTAMKKMVDESLLHAIEHAQDDRPRLLKTWLSKDSA